MLALLLSIALSAASPAADAPGIPGRVLPRDIGPDPTPTQKPPE